jgi:hypothetical protein
LGPGRITVGPDRLKKIEAVDAQAARIIGLAKEYVRLIEIIKVPGVTDASIREHSMAKRQAADYYDALKAALAGTEIEQGSLIDG